MGGLKIRQACVGMRVDSFRIFLTFLLLFVARQKVSKAEASILTDL